MKLALTVPVYSDIKAYTSHPAVEAVRINTALPIHGNIEEIFAQVKKQAEPKDVWIDIKGRQLRIAEYNIRILHDGEVHCISLSHNILANLPAQVLIDDGNYTGVIKEIADGNKIIVYSSAERNKGLPLAGAGKVGIRPGMSVSILDKSLSIEGYLTKKDREAITAARDAGLNKICASYFEHKEDIEEILKLNEDAQIILKVESEKGLDYAAQNFSMLKQLYPGRISLMAARGDMYVELDMPDRIIDACETIIQLDKDAIFASRLFESLKDIEKVPKCQDFFDLYCAMKMGYSRFMLGDDICYNPKSVSAAINLFGIISEKYGRYEKHTILS